MARWTVLVFAIAACNYAPDRIASGSDGPPNDTADPPIDAPELDQPRVRTIVVVDQRVTGGPHTDFPIAIAFSDSDLRDTSSGGRVISANGFDIRFFADAAMTMPLAYEVERYDGTTGQLFAWIKIPQLSAATTFFIYYGDPALTASAEDRPAVWSNAFAAVYHLTDATDATGANNGTNVGSAPATGRVEGGRSFNGVGDRIDIAAGASIDNVFAGGGTVEAWAFADTGGGGSLGRIFEKGDVVRVGRCEGALGTPSVFFSHAFMTTNGTWCSNVTVALATWVHIAVVYNRNNTANLPAMYIDGVETAITAVESPAGGNRSDAGGILAIGDKFSGTRAFDGLVDELRFARATRDAAWIATSYENQRDPAGFVRLQ